MKPLSKMTGIRYTIPMINEYIHIISSSSSSTDSSEIPCENNNSPVNININNDHGFILLIKFPGRTNGLYVIGTHDPNIYVRLHHIDSRSITDIYECNHPISIARHLWSQLNKDGIRYLQNNDGKNISVNAFNIEHENQYWHIHDLLRSVARYRKISDVIN